jgi:hypothetical protein
MGFIMCEEKYRLVNEYATAALVLSKVALKLRRLHGEEFTTACAESEAARAECAKRWEALLSHKNVHACDTHHAEVPLAARATA